MVKTLLTAKAKVNVLDGDGFSPLMFAAHAGHTEVVKVLIKAGANVNQKDEKGKVVPLISAVDQKNVELVKTLLLNGAKVNVQGQIGESALFVAAFHGRLDIIQLLLEYGADVSLKDAKGETALDWASKNTTFMQTKLVGESFVSSVAQRKSTEDIEKIKALLQTKPPRKYPITTK